MKKNNNTSTKIETFRPFESEDYMPEKDSALWSVNAQSRGNTLDERNQNDIRKHSHDGTNSRSIYIKDLAGFVRTVAAAPTWTPTDFFEQFALYAAGGVFRLYAYDSENAAWRFVVLT